jgi:hypothetical protein
VRSAWKSRRTTHRGEHIPGIAEFRTQRRWRGHCSSSLKRQFTSGLYYARVLDTNADIQLGLLYRRNNPSQIVRLLERAIQLMEPPNLSSVGEYDVLMLPLEKPAVVETSVRMDVLEKVPRTGARLLTDFGFTVADRVKQYQVMTPLRTAYRISSGVL